MMRISCGSIVVHGIDLNVSIPPPLRSLRELRKRLLDAFGAVFFMLDRCRDSNVDPKKGEMQEWISQLPKVPEREVVAPAAWPSRLENSWFRKGFARVSVEKMTKNVAKSRKTAWFRGCADSSRGPEPVGGLAFGIQDGGGLPARGREWAEPAVHLGRPRLQGSKPRLRPLTSWFMAENGGKDMAKHS